MKSQITYILKILAAWCIMILLSGCMASLPKVRSGNTELGFGVFSNSIPPINQYDRNFSSPTSFGISIHY